MIEELTKKLELRFNKIIGAYAVGQKFFAPRLQADPSWVVRSVKIEGTAIYLGHLTWNFDDIKNTVLPKHYPWHAEDRIKFEPMIEYDGNKLGPGELERIMEFFETTT